MIFVRHLRWGLKVRFSPTQVFKNIDIIIILKIISWLKQIFEDTNVGVVCIFILSLNSAKQQNYYNDFDYWQENILYLKTSEPEWKLRAKLTLDC